MRNADMPAYPHLMKAGEVAKSEGGLTKREYFAAMAMQGLLASGIHQVDDTLCHEAWSAANLMLAYQEKTS